MAEAVKQAVPVPWSTAFGRGFAAPWLGFAYLCKHPALWLYGIVPVLLNLVITAFVLTILIGAAIAFMTYLHPKFPEGTWGILLEIVTALGLLVATGTLAFVVWILMLGILVGHSLGRLAKRVELQLGTPPDQLQDIPWMYQVVDSFRDVGMLIVINGGTLLLHLIPGLGSVLAVAVSLYFDSLLFGAEVFDYPLMLRGMRRDEKWRFLKAHRPYTLGIGFVTLVVGMIPLIGPIFMTTATVGAVLLYHELVPMPQLTIDKDLELRGA
jgi:CysZ protein